MRTAIYAFLAFLLIGGALALVSVRGLEGNHPIVRNGADRQVPSDQDAAVATFAGGCFWCMEEVFEEVPGVQSAVSGYAGGSVENPTYEQVSAGGTGHTEAVRVIYDPDRISYARLLDLFWRNIDPLTPDRQFCDRGSQYRAAIFYRNETQKRLAEESKRAIEESGRFDDPVVTEIVPAKVFYEAEAYHQDYYRKNPIRYKFYKWNCGRAQRLEALWG